MSQRCTAKYRFDDGYKSRCNLLAGHRNWHVSKCEGTAFEFRLTIDADEQYDKPHGVVSNSGKAGAWGVKAKPSL